MRTTKNKKHLLAILLVLVAVLALSFTLAACNSDEQPEQPKDPAKTTYTVTIAPYEATQGTVTLAPASADGKYEEGTIVTVTVSAKAGFEVQSFTVSTDQNAALDSDSKYKLTVSANTTITATFKSSNVAVTSVTVSPAQSSLEVGRDDDQNKTVQLTAEVLPANATNKAVTWTSEDPTIATVSETGIVTAIAEGSATIKATAGGIEGTATITVSTHSHAAAAEAAWQNEDGKHYKLCACGHHVDEDTCAAAPEAQWQKDDFEGTHFHICATCGEHCDEAEHQLEINVDKTQFECKVCDYIEAHTHRNRIVNVTEGEESKGHREECEIPGCGYIGETNDHTMVINAAKDAFVCTECHYSEEHSHQLEWKPNGGNTACKQECVTNGCGWREEKYTWHNDDRLEFSWDQEAGAGKDCIGTCKYCHAKMSGKAHDYQLSSDETNEHWTCSRCEYAETIAHRFNSWVSVGDQGHKRTCSNTTSAYHRCNYEEIKPHDTSGDNGSCSVCGNIEAHDCKDEADEHGYRDGVCDICGFVYENTWEWTTMLSGYNGTIENLLIPDFIKFEGVGRKAINSSHWAHGSGSYGNGLFYGNESLKKIIMKSSTGNYIREFVNIPNLDTLIILPNSSSDKLGKLAIRNVPKLETLMIPNVTNIENDIFSTDTHIPTHLYFAGTQANLATLKGTLSSYTSKSTYKLLSNQTLMTTDCAYKADDAHTPLGWHWKIENVEPEPHTWMAKTTEDGEFTFDGCTGCSEGGIVYTATAQHTHKGDGTYIDDGNGNHGKKCSDERCGAIYDSEPHKFTIGDDGFYKGDGVCETEGCNYCIYGTEDDNNGGVLWSAWYGPATITKLEVPTQIGGKNVTGSKTFATQSAANNAGLSSKFKVTHLHLPATFTKIGDYTFSSAAFEEFDGADIVEIGKSGLSQAFATTVKTLSFPKLTKLGDSNSLSFKSGSELEELYLPEVESGSASITSAKKLKILITGTLGAAGCLTNTVLKTLVITKSIELKQSMKLPASLEALVFEAMPIVQSGKVFDMGDGKSAKVYYKFAKSEYQEENFTTGSPTLAAAQKYFLYDSKPSENANPDGVQDNEAWHFKSTLEDYAELYAHDTDGKLTNIELWSEAA